MRCITCQAEIPPSFIHSIQTNICAGCGGPIMDEASKEILNELKEAMGKMPNDPEGLAGWLLSNYTLTKIGAAEPTEFHRKPTKQVVKDRKLKVAKNPVQEFLKRKDPNIAKSVESLASIADQINRGEINEEMYGDGEELDPEAGGIDEEVEYEETEAADMDPEEEAIYNRQNFKSKAKKLAKHSLLMPGGRALSAEETAAMMQSVAGKASGVDPGDNMPEALQAGRIERLRKQRAIAGGGTDDFGLGRGTFRRT